MNTHTVLKQKKDTLISLQGDANVILNVKDFSFKISSHCLSLYYSVLNVSICEVINVQCTQYNIYGI